MLGTAELLWRRRCRQRERRKRRATPRSCAVAEEHQVRAHEVVSPPMSNEQNQLRPTSPNRKRKQVIFLSKENPVKKDDRVTPR